MNNRIIELAEQAAEYTVLNPSDELLQSEVEGNLVQIPRAFIEEFSRLLVSECSGITLDYKNDDHYQGWCDHAEEILKQLGDTA